MKPDRHRLRILRSDLKDTNDPKILKKYPHLDNEKHREELREAIRQMENQQ